VEQAEALQGVLGNTARLVEGISPDQWDSATPCEQWNVRQLVTHTAGVMANFANAAANQPIVGEPDDFDLGTDPGSTMGEVAAANVAAWRSRGELDSSVSLGENELPGMVAININMLDAYVHGWDIAEATGQEAMLDEQMCTALLGFAKEVVPATPREGDNFHAVVPIAQDAGAADQLLGYLGRQP
jgi:uncharacterized protein (TIGR03086 family)